MNYHKLLQKQIKKTLPAEFADNPIFEQFINCVNDSYLAFERDREIINNAFQQSESEYNELTDQLKKEIEFKQLAANNLYENINRDDLEYDIKYEHNDDLLFVSEYLRQQIKKRKTTEAQLHETVALLRTLLENFKSGIMAEDENRKMIFANQLYCDMRNIKQSPDELVGIDCSVFIHEVKVAFKDSQKFVESSTNIIKNKKLVIGELLETVDNHIIERDYIPIFINRKYKGHLWKYTDVTAKVKTLKLLEQSEEHNRLIMSSSLNSIMTINSRNKKITFWNHQAENIFGWKNEEAIGKNMIDLIVPERNRYIWNDTVDDYLQNGHGSFINQLIEVRLVNKAGLEFFGEISIIPINQHGEIYFCAFLQDISKRKEAERKQLQTVELLKTLLANLQSGVIVEDQDRKILFTNKLFCDLFSIPISPEKMIGIDCTNSAEQSKELFKEPDLFSPRINVILQEQKAVTDELLETADNRFLSRDYIPIFIDGEYKGHLWKYTDVTQKMQSQNQLIQSENRSKLIMNASLNAIITIDVTGTITFWNRQAENIFGWSRNDAIGKNLSETIMPRQHVASHHNGMSHYMETGEGPALNKPLELTALNKSGIEFPIEITIIPIHEDDNVFFCAFIQDVSEKKEAENIRKVQEEKYQNVIAHMNLGLVEVDNDGVIQYVNQSFATISGYQLDELVGKKPADLFVYGNNFDTVENKTNLRTKGVSDIYQLPVKNKSGDLRWWAISGAPSYDNKGNVIGSIGIHLDITEQKQLELDLEKEKTNALESAKAKETFLANMSHEIRTPLNAIIGFLRELDKQELTQLQKKYIDNSTIASKHLLAIINNILDISKIEAGEMSLELEDFVFEKSISNVATVLQPSLEQKGLNFNILISKEIEKVLKGDALRLQQILFNLVGNSIKFTSKGSVSINCVVVESTNDFQELKISISDTGIGMERGFMKNIFNKFSQEDKAVTRKYGGTGLGLSITNELIKLMGGRIEIESKKNVGTTFHVYINFPKGNSALIEDDDVEATVSTIENLSILLVEDNFLNRMVAQNSLQYYNCKVTEAVNGVEAIELLKKNKFDVILMDIQMPEMGGIEATEIIRNRLHLSTPIIALTANAFKTEIDRCKKAGMDDYVTKPFEEEVLIETIAKHTTNKKTSMPKAKVTEIAATSTLYNLFSLQSLCKGNNEFLTEMIAVFIEQTTDVIEKCEATLIQNNFIEVSGLIHKIRPSVEMLGIASIYEEMKLLEKIAKESTDKDQIATLFTIVKDVLEKSIAQLKEIEQ